ncbi:hypothetical protein LguiB_012426 [Lonicera macranthoides]
MKKYHSLRVLRICAKNQYGHNSGAILGSLCFYCERYYRPCLYMCVFVGAEHGHVVLYEDYKISPSSWDADNFIGVNQGSAGHGFAARDHLGVLLFAGMGSVFGQSFLDIQLVEAMAICEGLIAAKHCGVSRIVVESDALIMVDLHDSNQPTVAEIGTILNDLYHLSSGFEVVLCFLGKMAIRAAYNLVNFVLNMLSWRPKTPSCQ